jgi:beta-glucosidase
MPLVQWEVAREAVRQSLVLLKNNAAALPLDKTQSIVVAGEAADDIGLACGGWSVEWQGGKGAITQGQTLLDGIKVSADGIYCQGF